MSPKLTQTDPRKRGIHDGVRLDSASETVMPFSWRVLRTQHRQLGHLPPLDQLEQKADIQLIDVLDESF